MTKGYDVIICEKSSINRRMAFKAFTCGAPFGKGRITPEKNSFWGDAEEIYDLSVGHFLLTNSPDFIHPQKSVFPHFSDIKLFG